MKPDTLITATRTGPDAFTSYSLVTFCPATSEMSNIPIPEGIDENAIHQLASDIAQATGLRVTVKAVVVTQTTYGRTR